MKKLNQLIELADKYDYKPDDIHRGNLSKFVAENASLISCLCKDYAALQQQVNALAAENDQLRKWLISDTMTPIDETAFASTDAIKRQWMADGVEQAARKIQEHIWDENEGDGIVATIDALEIIAAKLRAGEQGGDHV